MKWAVRTALLTIVLLLGLARMVDAQDQIASGTLDSTTCPGTGCVTLLIAGAGSGGLQLSGTWVATVEFKATINGTTWFDLPSFPVGSSTAVTSATANGSWIFGAAGYAGVQARVTAYTSGTVEVTERVSGAAQSTGGGGGGAVTNDVLTDVHDALNQAIRVRALGTQTVTEATGAYVTQTWMPSGVNDSRSLVIPSNAAAGVVNIQLFNTGSFIGTISLRGGMGTDNYISAVNLTDGTGPTQTLAFNKLYAVPAAGLTDISIAATAYTSGFLEYEMGAGPGSINVPLGTQAISAASLPLPAGAATSGNQTTGNTSLASIKTNTDPLVASGAGGYVRQDSTATIAKETGGNLGTVKTNTDPLVAAGAGGYVRQDSTATIAKETGGNLAAIKTDVDKIPAQGQALAAASMPVVLTAAQLATLAAAASQTNGTQKTQLVDALAHVGVITTNGSLRVTSVENDAFQQIQSNTTNSWAELQAIDANQSNGSQLTRIRGLTGGELTIAGASTAALATESSAIVQESPNSFLNTFIAPGGGGYVRQDSTATIAKETGGNLDTLKTNTDPFKVSFAGGYVRQDSTGTIAKETGGNLAATKTNTDPFVAAGAGGYVRQDSTATIAKETGGNLAATKTNTDKLDIALSTLRDALAGASPNTKTLQDLYTLIASTITAQGATAPATSVVLVSSARTLPLPPCNPVRRTACSPKGF